MPKGLVIILGFVVILAIGAGGYFFMNNKAVAAPEIIQEIVKSDVETFEYVHLNPITVPILSDDGSTQIITMVVSIEVADLSAVEFIDAKKIRLTDAFLTDMYGILDQNRLLRNGFVDVERVKFRLNRIAKKIAGEENFSKILLRAVQQRKV